MKRFSRLRERLLRSALALFALAFTASAAMAQVPSSSPPYNVDIGAVITNTARAPSTVNSPQQNNLDKDGVICTINATALSGSPSATIAIQNFDVASQQYYTALISSSISLSTNTPVSIALRPGNQTSGANASFSATGSVPLARYWRVQQVITGANTTVTGTVGCNVVK